MKNKSEKLIQTNLSFVTIALVAVSSLLRLIVGNTSISVKTISVLNIIMLSYVVYRIMTCIYRHLINNDKHDSISKNQINACKRFITILSLVFLAISFLYICCQFWVDMPYSFGIANDIIAIVTFGVSIEEETIEELLLGVFEENTFM